MAYWLIKSEPDAYGIDHLENEQNQITHWDGIRNYQARNIMRDEMKVGDKIFFYHSNCKPPGIVGMVEVVKEAYPDHTALDPKSKYFDPKASEDNPRWCMVDVKLIKKFKRKLSLDDMRNEPSLAGMQLLRRGNRLSITPVTEDQWNTILEMLGEV